ncbi:MAG TPA: class II aldolase/adducin family protein [Pseudomonadales bacterium]
MNENRLRAHLLRTARALNSSGLNHGKAGNVSVRCGDGFLITPSGIAYEKLTTKQLVRVDANDQWADGLMPSTEWSMHRGVYAAHAEIQALVHAHPRHATALACTRQGIPAFHYMVAVAGGHDIPCCAYETFGTDALAHAVTKALSNRKACLMANHGLMATGADLDSALSLATEVENLAAQYLLAKQAGNMVLLTQTEMDAVMEQFRSHYGQSRLD